VLIALYDAERATRWRALALLVVAQATVAIVHVSYVYFVGLAGLGYLVTWLIAGEKSRDIVRRHLLVGGSLLVVTVAAVGVLLPRLQTLETFASGKGASAADIALAQLDTPRGAVLGDLFRGTTHAYHLRADYLVWPGVLSIVAVVLVPLLLLVRNRPGVLLLLGSTGAALVASQSNQLFPLLVQTAGAPQAKRLFLVVPTVAIIGTLLALVAVAIDRLLTHARASAATQPGRHVLIVAQPRSRRSQRGDLWLVAGLAAVALLALGAQRFPSLDTLHPRVIPEWPIRLLFIVMVVLALLAIVRKFVPALQTRNLPLVAGLAVSKTAVAATVVALAIGMSPAFVRMGPELSNHVARRAYDASYDAALGVGFKPQLLRAINALPIGSTIMTQPHAGYLVMALAPVYVVSSEPGHTANTPRNHLAQRYQVVEDFYRSNATDVARLKTLSDQHAVMLVATTKDASIVAFARRFPPGLHGHRQQPLHRLEDRPPTLARCPEPQRIWRGIVGRAWAKPYPHPSSLPRLSNPQFPGRPASFVRRVPACAASPTASLHARELRQGRQWVTRALPHPPIFLIGAPRSGSTLAYQVVTDRFDVGYLANGHARWPGGPSIVERRRHLISQRTGALGDFRSAFGATEGDLGPSECGPFWYRFFPRTPHHVPAAEFPDAARAEFRAAVGAFIEACARPVVFKNLYCTTRIDAIAAALPEALFIVIDRDLVDNARSLLNGRLRNVGSYDQWWSVEPPGIEQLRTLPPHEQVIGQVRAIDALITAEQQTIGSTRVLHVAYEDLCADTHAQLERIALFVAAAGEPLRVRGEVPESFPRTDSSHLPAALDAALRDFAQQAVSR